MPFFGPKNYSEMLWKIALADFWLTLACTFLVRQDPWVDGLFSRLEHLPGFREFATAVKAPDVNLGGFAIALAVHIFSRVTRFHDRISDFFKIRARFDRANILLPLAVMSGVHMTPRQIENLKRDRHPLMRETFCKYASSRSEKPLVDKHDIESALEDLALDIARRCQGLLTSAPSKWTHFFAHPAEIYRRAVVELGYDYGPRKLNTKGLLHDFCEFYQAAFLSKLGITISAHYRQPAELLNRRFDHPLIHVLMQRFLEQRAEETNTDFKFTPKQIGPIRCPNPYAAHPVGFRIENIVHKRSPEGSAYFIANCACGYGFTFRRSDDQDPTIPIVQHRVRFGETFEREAQRLYCKTPSISFVAKMMDVSKDVARRLIRGQKSKRESRRDPDRIAKLRAEWMTSKSVVAYRALRQYDRAWILEQKKEGGPRFEKPHKLIPRRTRPLPTKSGVRPQPSYRRCRLVASQVTPSVDKWAELEPF